MATDTKEVVRRRFVRNPERVDKIVLEAIQKLRAEQGDTVKASPDKLIEAMDKRLKMRPSRITVYRAVQRLANEGKFEIQRGEGKRPRMTYHFITSVTSAPAPAIKPVPNGELVARIRGLVEHERFLYERNAQLEKELAEIQAVVASAA